MTGKDDRTPLILAWAWVLGLTLFRLIYVRFFPLAPDEANYWQWSRYLDWGYHDHPPMIAWTIRLATEWFGHTELAVRLPSVIGMAVAALYLVGMAARWVDKRAALHTALITQATLGFNAGALIAAPDALQAAAWAGAAYHVARAYESRARIQWISGGVWFGIGLLSKYTMLLFAPAVLGYGLFSSLHRRRLAGIWPLAGLLIGLLVFMPVILWNAAQNWNSLRHIAHIGGADHGLAIRWAFFGDYLASQAGLLSPLLFLLALMAWAAVIRKAYPAGCWIYPYLAWTSLPVFIGFALLSLHTRVYGNWPGAGFLTAAVLTAALYGRKPRHLFAKTGPGPGCRLFPWALGSAYVMTALVLVHLLFPVLPVPAHMDRTVTELAGWRELGSTIAPMVQTMPTPSRTFIFGLDYQMASELAFYTPGKPRTVSINRWSRPNVYDYWWQDENLTGWDAVGVTFDRASHEGRLDQVFDRVDPPVRLDIVRRPAWTLTARAHSEPVQTFYMYRAYGFRGGLRWAPPKSGDIRGRPGN
ncbi:MAG: glycosyltransferase family 39 protein [Thermodesulfobacteriota bacterium]